MGTRQRLHGLLACRALLGRSIDQTAAPLLYNTAVSQLLLQRSLSTFPSWLPSTHGGLSRTSTPLTQPLPGSPLVPPYHAPAQVGGALLPSNDVRCPIALLMPSLPPPRPRCCVTASGSSARPQRDPLPGRGEGIMQPLAILLSTHSPVQHGHLRQLGQHLRGRGDVRCGPC